MKRSQNLLLVLAVLLALPLAACGSPAEPAETLPEPGPAVDSTPFTITQFQYADFVAKSRESAEYLQGLLQKKGWNMKLDVQQIERSDATVDYGTLLESSAAAGTPADGYELLAADAVELMRKGLVQNMAGAMKQAAPILYSRYAAFLGRDGCGIPMSATRHLWIGETVLYLRNGLAEGRNDTGWKLTDALTLLESDGGLRLGVDETGYYCVPYLLNAWLGEKGYYTLEMAGIRCGFAASMQDEQCVPVPVEDIQGFDDVFRRILALVRDGRFFGIRETEGYADDAAGYIGPLNGMDPVFLLKQKRTGNDFTALPLAGCGEPMLPEDDPYVYTVLAVPAQNRKAETLARFAEWAAAGREGSDLVRLGAEGYDYRIVDDRIEYLSRGKPMRREDWDPSVSKAYHFNYALFFSSALMGRATVYSPRNMESLASGGTPFNPPLFSARELQVPFYLQTWRSGVLDETLQDIAGRRETLLRGVTRTENGGDQQSEADECLAQLRAMSADTEKIVEAYRAKIQELLEGQPK